MKVAAIIQARTGSTRFPSKVFAPLADKPLLWHIVNRLTFSKQINEIIVATTTSENDNVIEDWALQNGMNIFRGSEEDVLARYYEAAKFFKADIIVRVTADDPFKDPEIIDAVIEILKSEKLDFAYNNNPPSFPEGLDTEVFTFEAIEKAFLNAKDNFEREHVTQYFYRNPTLFKHKNYAYFENKSYLRWTLDTVQDYEMVKQVYNHLYKEETIFLMNDIFELLKKYPAIANMNLNVKRSAMYS